MTQMELINHPSKHDLGVIVIGMHRSGTSALSGELSRLGVFMGKTLLKPQKGVNDKGFYENARLLELNEQLLDRLHLSWDYPLLPPSLPESLSESFKKQCLSFLKSEYGTATLWGMKDPRVSILLPFWHSVFKAASITPVYVLMIRHPLEVAASLHKRDGFSEDKSLMLWLNYNFFSYLYSTQSRRVIIDFEALLDNPEKATRPLVEILDVDHASQQESSFIDKKLKRQVIDTSSVNGILPIMAVDLYRAIKADNMSEVERLFEQYQVFQSSMHPVLKEHLMQVQASEVHFRHRFEKLYASMTWQLVRPLKKLESMFTTRQF
ncbi:sulfotransferase family protein [Thalassotalea litorea]|uniref:sulfotransferase family protein n=1 Tax=Thalassotalea litorea TaxID=2020715 RepID=UPI003735585B